MATLYDIGWVQHDDGSSFLGDTSSAALFGYLGPDGWSLHLRDFTSTREGWIPMAHGGSHITIRGRERDVEGAREMSREARKHIASAALSDRLRVMIEAQIQSALASAPMRLTTSAGTYEADTIVGLLFEVARHRFWHWRRGDGWVD